ncbi:MAG: 5'-nucleotidase C-terminal domain-containing protein, partial [Syntrophothermus sp.]
TILHVNDSHSNIAGIDENTKGGIARIATVIGMTKMEDPNALVLHAGDAFIGDIFCNVFGGVPEFTLMNQLGFDAMTIGNHEFDFYTSNLRASLEAALKTNKFPLLSANLNLQNPDVANLSKYIKDFTIIHKGNLKIGVFGLTTPATNLISFPQPAFLSEDIIGIATKVVKKLSGCDVVICLSHLGVDIDQALAAYVPGIDIIVGGHDHFSFEEPIEVSNPEGGVTYIVQVYGFYTQMGKLIATIENKKVTGVQYNVINIDNSIPEVSEVKAVVDNLISQINEMYFPAYGINLFTNVVGYATADFPEYAGDLFSLGYHDTPLGNLITSAAVASTGAQIGITVSGFISQPLYAGNLTAADLFRAIGYGANETDGLGYRLVTVDLTGADIMTGLGFALSQITNDLDEFLPQVTGMQYKYRINEEEAELYDVNIEPTQTYTVVMNEFLYGMFNQLLGIEGTNLSYNHPTEFQSLLGYVVNAGGPISPVSSNNVECVTGLPKESSNNIPEKLELLQNYPNPFNPSTKIVFNLPESGLINLEVYNSIGEKIETLISGNVQAGMQEIIWNGSNYTSGIYLVRLITGDNVKTIKMMLMK